MTGRVESQFQLATSTLGCLSVTGVLDFSSAAAALRAIELALGERAVVQLDLSGVTHADSAGLSCLVAVVADAARQGRSLAVTQMPAGMKALAKVSEVDQLICA